MEHADGLTGMASSFLGFSRNKLLDQFWPRLRECVEKLTDEQVWWRPNAASNSVGNLILHLNGNVRQWLIASFTKNSVTRDRTAEFSAKEGMSAAELLQQLDATMHEVKQALEQLTQAELDASYDIQGYRVTGLEAVYHVVEHFAMHYGQIVYITKLLCEEDLGFYRGLNATGRATGEETTIA